MIAIPSTTPLWRPPSSIWTPPKVKGSIVSAGQWIDRALRDSRRWLSAMMGLPKSKGGLPMSCGGLPVNDTGGSGCCGSGSGSCPHCDSPVASTVLATFSEAFICPGCIHVLPDTGGEDVQFSGDLDGYSVCVPQTSRCAWLFDGSGPVTTTTYFEGCAGTPIGVDDAIEVAIGIIDDNTIEVVVYLLSGGPGTSFVIFHGTASLHASRDCSTSVTVFNEFTESDCGHLAALGTPPQIMGYGGSVTLTFGGC